MTWDDQWGGFRDDSWILTIYVRRTLTDVRGSDCHRIVLGNRPKVLWGGGFVECAAYN